MAFVDFPTEILLKIVEQLPLSALLIFRGVSREWWNLIDNPALDIPQERQDLYNLYIECINTPAFIKSRSWISQFLTPYNRQAYINAIYEQTHFIPVHFQFFILEWPDMAAIPHIWPGLPIYYSLKRLVHASGGNLLAKQPPSVSVAEYYHTAEDLETYVNVPCLIVHAGLSCMPLVALCLDEGSTARGKVYLSTMGQLYFRDLDDDDKDEGIDYDNWVDFLRDFGLGRLKDNSLWCTTELKTGLANGYKEWDDLSYYDWVQFCSKNTNTNQI